MELDYSFRNPKILRRIIHALLFLIFFIAFRTEIWISIKFLLLVLYLIIKQPFAILLNAPIRQETLTEISKAVTLDVFRSLWVLSANAGMYFVLFMGSLFITAQFALPIQNHGDRWPAFWRLLLYRLRKHGAALFVREGRRIARQNEDKSYLPGVVLVDSNSAIVVERQKPSRIKFPNSFQKMSFTSKLDYTPVSRVEGPGLVFTDYGEKICGEVDLRKQVRIEPGVQAYTRDGIKIHTNVVAVITLGEPPEIMHVMYRGDERTAENLVAIQIDERTISEVPLIKRKFIKGFYPLDSQDAEEIDQAFQRGELRSDSTSADAKSTNFDKFSPPYHFDSDRVSSAVYARYYQAEGKDVESWTDLPVKVATEIFRNQIALYAYDYLYRPENENDYPLKDFKADFARLMRYQGVMSYRFVRGKHRPLEIGVDWDEASVLMSPTRELVEFKLLRDYGIKVIHAGFGELEPEDGIRKKRLENWIARWEKEIEIIKAEHELKAIRIKNNARAQAQLEMASSLSSLFRNAKSSPQAMALRVFQALETAATDPTTSKFLPHDVISMIQNLQRWLILQRRSKELPSETNQNREQK